jgi:hypothetical protein
VAAGQLPKLVGDFSFHKDGSQFAISRKKPVLGSTVKIKEWQLREAFGWKISNKLVQVVGRTHGVSGWAKGLQD